MTLSLCKKMVTSETTVCKPSVTMFRPIQHSRILKKSVVTDAAFKRFGDKCKCASWKDTNQYIVNILILVATEGIALLQKIARSPYLKNNK